MQAPANRAAAQPSPLPILPALAPSSSSSSSMPAAASPTAAEPGLRTLIEAAVALTQLVSSAPPPSPASSSASPELGDWRPGGGDPPSSSSSSSSSSSAAASSPPKTRRGEIFPRRLMRALSSSDPSVRSVVTFLPHGRSFAILRPDLLAERVLPVHFPESSGGGGGGGPGPSRAKYSSFTRKLNRWGFRQISEGNPDAGAFHHPLFRRDEPNLCSRMECKKSRGVGSRSEKEKDRDNDGDTGGPPIEREARGAPDPDRSRSRVPIKKRKLPPSPAPTAEGWGPPPHKRLGASSASGASIKSAVVASASTLPPAAPLPPLPETGGARSRLAATRPPRSANDDGFVRLRSLEALRAAMESIRRLEPILPEPTSGGAVPVEQRASPHYEPNIHVVVPGSGGGAPSPTPERRAAALRAAEEHRSMLYSAYMQAMSV